MLGGYVVVDWVRVIISKLTREYQLINWAELRGHFNRNIMHYCFYYTCVCIALKIFKQNASMTNFSKLKEMKARWLFLPLGWLKFSDLGLSLLTKKSVKWKFVCTQWVGLAKSVKLPAKLALCLPDTPTPWFL